MSVSLVRKYVAVGNWPDDEDTWQKRLEEKAGVSADWSKSQRNRVKRDQFRRFEDVEAAVKRSKQVPVQIEGSLAVPSLSYKTRLRERGYIVI